MTAYEMPGQTYYSAGLVVEGQGVRMLFVGDSMSPTGIDDYCAGNRNFLGDGVGFDACLETVQAVRPTHIFNCHIDQAFAFSDAEIGMMRDNLREREALYGELVPWDHPNYGLDPHWVRCHPYEQVVCTGEPVTVGLRVTNHSAERRSVSGRPVLPRQWQLGIATRSGSIPPGVEGCLPFRFVVPRNAPAGRVVVPFEVTYDGRRLGQFREAVIEVAAAR